MPSLNYSVALVLLSLLQVLQALAEQAKAESSSTEDNGGKAESSTTTTPPTPTRNERFGGAKVWYLSKVQLGGGIELPIDYVTLVIGVVSVIVLYTGLTGSGRSKASCTASHILIEKHDDATRELLEKLQKEIGSDAEAFAKCAAQHSTCPSKSNQGRLGTFPRGAMVPAFDKCCFDPQTPLQTAVGPVHTHFGYHLIYIHERKLPK